MPKRILITGGLGNLGSWFTSHFINLGYEVTVLSKNRRDILNELNFQFISCDISNYRDCLLKLKKKKFEYVVHAASKNDHFIDDYSEIALKVNSLGTRNLLQALGESDVQHFIYLSTFQIYGKYSGFIDEKTETKPINDYGATHLFAEYYVQQFGNNTNLPYSIIRLTNSYGCPKDINCSKWYLILNNLCKSAVEKKTISLKSNGLSPRDFIWMGTVCRVLEKLLIQKAKNTFYNLSGEKTLTTLDIANFVKDSYVEKFNAPIPISINNNDVTEYPTDLFVSCQKIKAIINLDFEEKFKEEISNIFDFLITHSQSTVQ